MTKNEYKSKMRKRSTVLIPLWLIGLFGVFLPYAYLAWFLAIPLSIVSFLVLFVSGAIMKSMSDKLNTLK